MIPVQTTLDWARLGAIPESFGTAWGSLDTLALERRQSLLVRGATSSVGLAAITIAKERRIDVFATTRQERKRAALEASGADHVIIDDGRVAEKVRAIAPDGVDGLLELVGPNELPRLAAGPAARWPRMHLRLPRGRLGDRRRRGRGGAARGAAGAVRRAA